MDRRNFLLASLATSALGSLNGLSSNAFGQAHDAPDAPTWELLAKLAHDPFRPQFHLLPRHNWMNDPCAPRFYRGAYHMFFQYNPHAAVWGDMHWNHATSPDLVHWKHEPVAIAPTAGSYDSAGIFTGSVLPGTEHPTVLYTGITHDLEHATIRGETTREVQCLAYSTDPELRTWQKLDKPVLPFPPEGLSVTGFRDPCPWKEGDTWYLIVASGFNQQGGAALLYTSKDAHNWTYLHPLAQGKWNGGRDTNPVDTGEMWECPDFFPLGGKHVLLYSTERKVYWEVGVFDKQTLKFTMETRGILDHGAYYAMKSMEDAKGRRILWGWVTERRPDDALKAAGWAGCMALPRVLTLGEDHCLRMEVIPELAALRSGTQSLPLAQNGTPAPDAIGPALAKMTIQDRAAEILLTFKPGAGPSSLEVRPDGPGAPLLSIAYNGISEKPALLVNSTTISGKTLGLTPNKDGFSTIHLFMDGSVIEILADQREAITVRDYTPTSGSVQLALTGDAASLRGLSVSAMQPISADRLTT